MIKGIELRVRFFKSESGNEPTREWLRSLRREDRKIIGDDIKTVQFGWPLGMPLVRKLDTGIWELRSTVQNRIARVLFTVDQDLMILLHGFIKKSQKLPHGELDVAKRRLARLRGDL